MIYLDVFLETKFLIIEYQASSSRKDTTRSNYRGRRRGGGKDVSCTLKENTVYNHEANDKRTHSNVCIFCDEEDPDFNEDTLISHYYNDCPVLTNCPMCQIVSLKRESTAQ